MTWRDQLQPASFRGVPFEEKSSTQTGGRRLVQHEYPQRDVPYNEDMGRRKRDHKVEAYVIGAEYMSGRDRLLNALEEEGPGQLVQRYRGTKLMSLVEYELTESTEFGGMAKFMLTFVEAGEQAQPTIGIDSGAELVATQEVAYAAITTDFEQDFSTDGLPSWGINSIQTSVADFLQLGDLRQSVAGVTSFKTRFVNLLGFPGTLAAEMIGLVRSLSSVQDVLSKPYVPVRVGALQSNSVRGVVQRQQAATTALIKRTALVHNAGLVSNAELSTSADVQVARADILRLFDEHDYAVGAPRPSAAVASALKSVRTAALVHLSRQNAALPRTYSMQLIESQPVLALSYSLYGELRNDDIVRRNAIRHPGFVPAGVPLQLPAE